MQAHHYLGALPKIGHTLWYVARHDAEWLALLSFSAAAWKCAVRDGWIGWAARYQYDRLHLIANNSRFLILPAHHQPNLASRVLALAEHRVAADWQARWQAKVSMSTMSSDIASKAAPAMMVPPVEMLASLTPGIWIGSFCVAGRST